MQSSVLSNQSDSKQAPALSTLVVRGGIWSGFSLLTSNLFTFVMMAVLAWLLDLQDYGLTRILISFNALITQVGELGLSAAIIQKKDLEDIDLHTAFWANVIMGFGLCLFTLGVASPVGAFFKNQRLAPVLWLVSISFVLNGLSAVHRALLTKQLTFHRLALPEVVAVTGFALLTIVLAILGWGILSMAYGIVFRWLLQSVLLWRVSAWRPRLAWSWLSFKKLFGFGFNVVLTNLLISVTVNIDFVIVGRVLGPIALSFYTLAYQLTTLPRQGLLPIVARVAFPTLALLQKEKVAFQGAYYKMISVIAMVMFPIFGLLLAVAPSFIRVVYGAKWEPAILPLRFLCVATALLCILSMNVPTLQAGGRPDTNVRQTILMIFALGLFIWIGSKFDVSGVAAAMLVYALVVGFVLQAWTSHVVGFSLVELGKILAPPILGCIVAGVVAFVTQETLANLLSWPSLYVLIAATLSGGLIYVGYLWLFQKQVLLELVRRLFSVLPQRAWKTGDIDEGWAG